MQVVIVTLHNVELLNQENKLQKISISLLFGENTKNIPKPRFIRSQVASFYKEKISISSTNPSDKTVKLTVYGYTKTEEQQIVGDFVFNIKQLEKKQGVNEKFQVQKDNFYLEFEALYSSNIGMSPRTIDKPVFGKDSKSISADVTPQKEERSSINLAKKDSRSSINQKQNFDQIKQASIKKLNALQKAQVTESPKVIKRQGSNRRLNRSISNNGGDDNKSQISQKPSQKKFERTTRGSIRDNDGSKSQSAYRPSTRTTLKQRERSVTPTKSVRTDRSGQITPRGQKIRPQRKQRIPVKKEPQLQFEQKDYIIFLAIAIVALIFGIIVKQA